MITHIILTLLSILFVVLAYPQVKVEQGILEGKIAVTDDAKVFYSFQGIPYAKSPVEKLRFQAPQPADSWEGIRKAKKEGNNCKQFHIFIYGTIVGDEDCLFLNVYTPKPGNNSSLPVMFFIHGGGFQAGFGGTRMYGPDWLIEEDVVLVTINYRLGVMGFLSLDIPEASGNAGLKDQVAALRWVKKNIRAFGGDPENVTIFGQSAGGASVGYLLSSDVTKGLFHKAISMSGSPLNAWAHIDNPKKNAFDLCKTLGYSATNEFDALQFLRSLPADKLYRAIGKQPATTVVAEENMLFRKLVFLPIVEKYFPGQHPPILNQTFLHRIASGNFHEIPFMVGHTEKEGYFALEGIEEDPVLYGLVDVNFERYVPKILCLKDVSNKSLAVGNAIKNYYYQNQSVDENTESFVEIKGDTWFNIGIDEMARIIAERSKEPVFYYTYSFSEFSFHRVLLGYPHINWTSHCDDLGYLFKHGLVDLPRNIADVEITRKRMVKMYTDFSKTGNPTPQVSDLLPLIWEPIANKSRNCLVINKTLRMVTNPNQKNIEFWESLVKEYSTCNDKTTISYTYNTRNIHNANMSIHKSHIIDLFTIDKLIMCISIYCIVHMLK